MARSPRVSDWRLRDQLLTQYFAQWRYLGTRLRNALPMSALIWGEALMGLPQSAGPLGKFDLPCVGLAFARPTGDAVFRSLALFGARGVGTVVVRVAVRFSREGSVDGVWICPCLPCATLRT